MTGPTLKTRDAPQSYWHTTSPAPIPSDPLPTSADVVVVGGGLLGCWTAYWLAKAGVQVTVLEATAISWGATGRNGGFVRAGTANGYSDAIARLGRGAAIDLWHLTEKGQTLVGEIIAEEKIDCDYRTPGTLSLALTNDSMTEMTQDLAEMQLDGLSGELIDRQAVQALVDTPLADEIVGAVYFEDGGLLHSSRYLAGIAESARRYGARFCKAEASALTPSNNGTIVSTTAGSIQADRVIVAVNAWSEDLVSGLQGLVVPVRGQILAYEPISPVFRSGIGASISTTGEYWQQTPDGSIVIGGCRAVAANGDLGIRDMIPTANVTDVLESVLPRLFPELNHLDVAQRWAGLMAFTSDYLPVADAAPDLAGVWITGGFCGHGMPFGPIIGQLLADAAISGVTPAALAPLRLNRPSLTPLLVPR